MRTPVDVSDEVFARVSRHFSNEALVEITALLTLVNLDRFNAALDAPAKEIPELKRLLTEPSVFEAR